MSDKLILTEWYELEIKSELVEEAVKTGQPLILKDRLLQRANIKNHNGRVYPTGVLMREVSKYNELVKQRRALGELDHPDSPVVELKNVSHLITNLYTNGDDVMGDIEVLNTPAGRTLREIIEQKVKIGISSRGLGSLQKEADTNVVQNDFELIAFDAVSSPSTPGAYLVTESKLRELDRFNGLRSVLHDILKDSYFDI
jgi:hypothetical protein